MRGKGEGEVVRGKGVFITAPSKLHLGTKGLRAEECKGGGGGCRYIPLDITIYGSCGKEAGQTVLRECLSHDMKA